MEFKVFKNENSKILKEYWLTQSEWDALDKTTVQEGDIYHIVGTIGKGDLSADVNASLAKADSSLQKPTATLAKESFVKVGIDGSQNFDENSYVIAPSTGGTAGQVLKKTSTGTVWANESGGGGGGGADIPEAKLNENIIKNPSKTYLVWKGNQFPNSTNATFKAPAGCTIDWGDGTVETFDAASTTVNTHTYTDGFEYHLISLSNYTVVDNGAFEYCSGLTSIIIGNGVTSIGSSAFRNCSGLTSITIPDSVTSIGNAVFKNCSGLTSIIIGNGVTSIGNAVFQNCSRLTSITIPDSVTSIEGYVFKNCSGLKIIKISAINPPTLGSDAFAETPLEKIIVPKSAINTYKSASGWSTYADKIVYEVDSSDLNGGGKLYLHDVTIRNNSGIELPIVKFKYISTDNNTFSLDKFNFYKCFDAYANDNSTPPKFYGVKDMSTSADSVSITYYTTYPYSVTSTATLPVQIADIKINDNIVEL